VLWKIYCKHTAFAREIAYKKLASVGLDCAAADTETKAQAGLITASLLEGSKQIFGISWRQASTFILDLHENAILGRKDF